MHVIGIGGIAGSGKTTAADYIQIESINFDCKPIRLSFADLVRKEAGERSGYDDWRILKEKDPNEYRKLCQSIADDGRPSRWVNYMNEKLATIQKQELEDDDPVFCERVVIIDDVRYENEIELLKAWHAELIFVFAGDRKVQNANGKWRAHESEWLNQKIEGGSADAEAFFKWSVFNNGSEMQFEKKLHDRLQYVLGVDPTRFANECTCVSCRGFRCDVQADELIAGFKEAIREARLDPNIPEDIKDDLIAVFLDYIAKLESGEMSPLDVINRENFFTTDDEDDDE